MGDSLPYPEAQPSVENGRHSHGTQRSVLPIQRRWTFPQNATEVGQTVRACTDSKLAIRGMVLTRERKTLHRSTLLASLAEGDSSPRDTGQKDSLDKFTSI